MCCGWLTTYPRWERSVLICDEVLDCAWVGLVTVTSFARFVNSCFAECASSTKQLTNCSLNCDCIRHVYSQGIVNYLELCTVHWRTQEAICVTRPMHGSSTHGLPGTLLPWEFSGLLHVNLFVMQSR